MNDMERLLQDAEQRGMWLYSRYAGLWFSPHELRERQRLGHFRWGAVNWEIRDPKDYLAELEEGVRKAKDKLANFHKQFDSENGGDE